MIEKQNNEVNEILFQNFKQQHNNKSDQHQQQSIKEILKNQSPIKNNPESFLNEQPDKINNFLQRQSQFAKSPEISEIKSKISQLNPSIIMNPFQINLSPSNFRKQKLGFIYSVNQIKNKSFVIKTGRSVSQNETKKTQNIKSQEKQKMPKHEQISKKDIQKVIEAIQKLENKLKIIEQKQNEMQKSDLQIDFKNSHEQQSLDNINNQKVENDQPFPLISNEEKMSRRLKFQSSIIQINQHIEQSQQTDGFSLAEKNRLKEEIGRLKDVIRSLQIQKIKEEKNTSIINQSPLRSITPRHSSLQKESASYNRLKDAGKIIHLPKISSKHIGPHQFLESSRIIESSQFTSMPKRSNNMKKSKSKFNSVADALNRTNPEDQISMLQVNFRDVQVPFLPKTPDSNMNQESLQKLAKQTYKIFGISYDEDKQLSVKKYKNCVLFSLINQPNQSILWHFSGKFYMGGWKEVDNSEGQKDGEGLELIPGKHIYKGQFLHGKKNGTGIMKIPNGCIYDGQWYEGNKSGRGIYFDASTKAVYNGEWKDNKKEGQGYQKFTDNQYYYGTFVKSVKEGFGEQTFMNGDRYKGQYKNGKFHGKGKYQWANGSCYQGEFSEGARHGQGNWKSGSSNYDMYVGGYNLDKKSGYGRYVWANGSTYQGQFHNDFKHGKGRITYQDGKEVKGVWKEGVMAKEDKQKLSGHEQQPLQKAIRMVPVNFLLSNKVGK